MIHNLFVSDTSVYHDWPEVYSWAKTHHATQDWLRHVTGSSSHSLRFVIANKEYNQKNLVERGEKGCVRILKTIPGVKDILDNNAYKA